MVQESTIDPSGGCRQIHPKIVVAISALALLALTSIAVVRSHHFAASTVIGLWCDEEDFSFGSINPFQAKHQTHRFMLVNTSDAMVHILQKEPSCGCTVVSLAHSEIGPGQTAELNVDVDWSGRVGAQIAHVRVVTDNATTPELLLTLRGVVDLPIIVSPREINFGRLLPDELRSRFVDLAPGSRRKPFKILDVSSTSANVSVSRATVEGGVERLGDSRRFLIQIRGKHAPGRESSNVIFATDLPEMPRVAVRISAECQGVLSAEPDVVLLNSSEQTALVRIHSDSILDLSKLKCEISVPPNTPAGLLRIDSTNLAQGDRRNTVMIRIVRAIDHFHVSGTGSLRVSVGSDRLDVPLVFQRVSVE